MYLRLSKKMTKKYYKEIVNETINETKSYLIKFPDVTIYRVIYNQIMDIKINVIEKGIVFTQDEVFKRYNLGAIAIKNFDVEFNEYGQKLSDISGGSYRYWGLPDE